jgi:DNA-directed RNA polymerase specialized sigma24 family protein
MLDWDKYIAVADGFQHKARRQDREDLKHTIILRLAQVASNNGHKPFTEAVMYRIARHVVADYWRSQYKLTNGLDCGSCSRKQRQKCRSEDLYRQCPKAIKLESLNKPIIDSEGHTTELGELIADDKALDLDAWADAKTFLLGFPKRLLVIADKMDNGEAFTNKDHQYLWYWRRKEQKVLDLS